MDVLRPPERRTHRRERPARVGELPDRARAGPVDPLARDLVVVANRLPARRDEGGWRPSPGGLVAEFGPALGSPTPCWRGAAWVGWTGERDHPGDPAGPARDQGDDPRPFVQDDLLLCPIALSPDDLRDACEGFGNTTLWPLYHDAIRHPEFHSEWWDAYVRVNERFARAAAAATAPGGIVWVHDYQLLLVPKMVRELRPDVRVGFFLHIPQPPPELYCRLPWRRELLEGMLGAHVIGFQTDLGVSNFRAAAEQVLGIDVDARCLPISIDTEAFTSRASSPATVERSAAIRSSLGDPRILLLGVDRLDYTKGIAARLVAFGEALRSGRLCVPDVTMVQVAVPSRNDVAGYADERALVEQLVGEINGRYGQVGAPAVHYLYRRFDFDDLVALYRAADVMLVTPYSDGMNLVAKGYVASRVDDGGALLLSEFTGAARELREAVLVNPYDNEAMVDALVAAVALEPDDRRARMRALRHRVTGWTVRDWSGAFLQALVDAP